MKPLFLLVATVVLTVSPGGARDWAEFPAVVQIEHANEIFAIGDAHSDFKRLARAMAAAGIIEGQVDKPEDAEGRVR